MIGNLIEKLCQKLLEKPAGCLLTLIGLMALLTLAFLCLLPGCSAF